MVLQSSITSVFRQVGNGGAASTRGLPFGTKLRFVASTRFQEEGRLDRMRMMRSNGVRPPRLALVSCLFFLICVILTPFFSLKDATF